MIRKLFEKIAIIALKAAVPHISEFIRRQLLDFVNSLYEKAQETPNPYDNYFLEILRVVLGAKKDGSR